MAPEQIRAGTVDERTDLHAVGATMYFALAGRDPFVAPSVPALMIAIASGDRAPLPDVDPRLAAIVDRAMEKDPAARFASAAEMRAALSVLRPRAPSELEHAQTVPALEPPRPPEKAREKKAGDRRERPRVALFGVTLLATIAIASIAIALLASRRPLATASLPSTPSASASTVAESTTASAPPADGANEPDAAAHARHLPARAGSVCYKGHWPLCSPPEPKCSCRLRSGLTPCPVPHDSAGACASYDKYSLPGAKTGMPCSGYAWHGGSVSTLEEGSLECVQCNIMAATRQARPEVVGTPCKGVDQDGVPQTGQWHLLR
jgi:serine/threonine protein kinase